MYWVGSVYQISVDRIDRTQFPPVARVMGVTSSTSSADSSHHVTLALTLHTSSKSQSTHTCQSIHLQTRRTISPLVVLGVGQYPFPETLWKTAMKLPWSRVVCLGHEQHKAFQMMKKVISKEALLAYPNFQKKFVIHTDTSHTQLGAVILQDGKPIAFYSRKLNPFPTDFYPVSIK